MFVPFLEWRKEKGADNALSQVKLEDEALLKEKYKHGYHGTDNEGRPFYFDCPGRVKIDSLLDRVNEEKMNDYYMREYERLIHHRLPAASKAAGKDIETSFSVLDMTGFSMGSLNKKTIGFVKLAIKMGQNYYPEIMHEMFIINCPLMFRAAYKMFKPFIDEKTRSKIHIRGGSFDDLFERVPKENVPKFIGGDCMCGGTEEGCNYSNLGPWNDFPGDEFAEAQFAILRAEEEHKKPEGDEPGA